ncbi:TDP-glucose-4,6-dehydratase [Terrihabitans soli]|uniref:TDP-glucose-4,6-dehydratase n=1 Tax=Terrihabitans soli TaxID=708113 RepID=A0A6S6QFQ0_9HYPH|nr:NAD(P)-dependent oxidoreductase [Terrihabitans soli]BCJ89923.1 TDP-glucose-4,6-dehydratase [Terrihabitans soli]
MRTRILITGAAGNLGGKLVAHFRAQGRVVTGIDRRNRFSVTDLVDLATPDAAWTELFSGQDAVLHLAANSNPHISADIAAENLTIDRNVAAACAAQNVPRLIFASSQWTMQGYFGSGRVFEEHLPPRPSTPYGEAKVQSEEELRHFKGTCLCLRVGHTAWRNRRRLLPPDEDHRHAWLSDRDLCSAFQRAVDSNFEGYTVLNITSANRGSRWPIARARQLIGYRPRDGTSFIDAFWGRFRSQGRLS